MIFAAVPKILADLYLDDRSFPPFNGWDEVYKKFVENKENWTNEIKTK